MSFVLTNVYNYDARRLRCVVHAWTTTLDTRKLRSYKELADVSVGRRCDISAVLPTSKAILSLQLFILIENEDGKAVLNPHGIVHVTVGNNQRLTAHFKVFETLPEPVRTAEVTIETPLASAPLGGRHLDATVRVLAQRGASVRLAAAEEFDKTAELQSLNGRRTTQVTNGLCRQIYMPYMNTRAFLSPPAPFAWRKAIEAEDRGFLSGALELAMQRRGYPKGEFTRKGVGWQAQIVGEAIQLVANSFRYTADVFAKTPRHRIPIERFEWYTRHIGTGDCEDLAKEILLLFDAFTGAAPPSPSAGKKGGDILGRASVVMQQYVPLFCVCAAQERALTEMQTAEKRVGGSTPSSFMSHAFVMLVPRKVMRAKLDSSRYDVRAGSGVGGDDLPLLTLEGTGLKQTCDRNCDSELSYTARRNKTVQQVFDKIDAQTSLLIKVMRDTPDFYKYIMSSLVCDMSITVKKTGMPVSQFRWHYTDARGKTTWGAPYDSLHLDNVKVVPNYEIPNSDYLDALLNVDGLGHPILAHRSIPNGISSSRDFARSGDRGDNAVFYVFREDTGALDALKKAIRALPDASFEIFTEPQLSSNLYPSLRVVVGRH